MHYEETFRLSEVMSSHIRLRLLASSLCCFVSHSTARPRGIATSASAPRSSSFIRSVGRLIRRQDGQGAGTIIGCVFGALVLVVLLVILMNRGCSSRSRPAVLAHWPHHHHPHRHRHSRRGSWHHRRQVHAHHPYYHPQAHRHGYWHDSHDSCSHRHDRHLRRSHGRHYEHGCRRGFSHPNSHYHHGHHPMGFWVPVGRQRGKAIHTPHGHPARRPKEADARVYSRAGNPLDVINASIPELGPAFVAGTVPAPATRGIGASDEAIPVPVLVTDDGTSIHTRIRKKSRTKPSCCFPLPVFWYRRPGGFSETRAGAESGPESDVGWPRQ
jgi:hypothetical protein